MKQNSLIAVTGGIASGKSQVMKIIESLGFKVLITDAINRELLSDENYLSDLREEFPEAFDELGFNKDKLKEIIFKSQANLLKIDELAHPRIIDRILEFKEENPGETIFVEISAPTKDVLEIFDSIIIIESNKAIRDARLKDREIISDDMIEKIQKLQEKGLQVAKKHKDVHIINNNEGISTLIQNIQSLLSEELE